MEGFVEIEAGLWYRESDGRPFTTKRQGNSKITDYPMKALLSKNTAGYYHVGSKGKPVQWHRLVYEFFKGKIPPKMTVDHFNNIRDDNRIENLKLLTRKQNQAKQVVGKRNKSGLPGVSWYKRANKWHSQIGINGKQKHLGYFVDPYLAYETFLKNKIKYHGKESIIHYPTLQEAKQIIKARGY